MAEEDIITLDSDDEDTTSAASNVSNLLSNGNSGGITIKRIPAAPKLIQRPRAGPSGIVQNMAPVNMSPIMARTKVPRKPGVFPPFALFSQEQRPEILREQPGISFGEIGRKLGEMWHALSEEQKEEYRRRAREISDQKMAEYQETK